MVEALARENYYMEEPTHSLPVTVPLKHIEPKHEAPSEPAKVAQPPPKAKSHSKLSVLPEKQTTAASAPAKKVDSEEKPVDKKAATEAMEVKSALSRALAQTENLFSESHKPDGKIDDQIEDLIESLRKIQGQKEH